jgi:hypothetical protein
VLRLAFWINYMSSHIVNTKLLKTLFVITLCLAAAVLADQIHTYLVTSTTTTLSKQPLDRKQCQSTASMDASSSWTGFVNERYDYSFEHPSLGGRSGITPEHDGTQPDQDNGIHFDSKDGSPIFGITVAGSNRDIAIDLRILHSMSESDPNRKQVQDTIDELSLDLNEFAEDIYNYQLTDPNPYTQGKQVGPFKATFVDGRISYEFTLTKDLGGLFGESLLPENEQYMYVITEAPAGDKIIIHYLIDDCLSEQMFRSFKFLQ